MFIYNQFLLPLYFDPDSDQHSRVDRRATGIINTHKYTKCRVLLHWTDYTRYSARLFKVTAMCHAENLFGPDNYLHVYGDFTIWLDLHVSLKIGLLPIMLLEK